MKEIPISEICKGISIRDVKINPKGTTISFVRKNIKGDYLCLLDYINRKEIAIKKKYFMNIVGYVWASTGKYILVVNDPSSNGLWEVWRYNLCKDIFDEQISFKSAQTKILGIDKKEDNASLGINNRNASFFDVYMLDIAEWSLKLIYENNYYYRLLFDTNLNIRLGCRMEKNGSSVVEHIESKKILVKIEASDFFGTFPLCITSDDRLLLRDSRKRDKSAIAKVNLFDGVTEILAHSEDVDVDESFIEPSSGDVAAVAFYYTRKEWFCFSEKVSAEFELLKKFRMGDISILSTTTAGEKWVVEYNNSDSPIKYALYDREKKRVVGLMNTGGEEYRDLYVKKHPIIIKNNNDDKILCYFMSPQINSNKALVTVVHGGPWQRDTCKFVYLHQWLVNRGFSVLTVNYRGSQGFGKRFLNDASKDWVKVLNDDIVVAIEEICKKNNLDRHSVAIMGNSFGGYLAQLGITERPDIFKCGISIGGVSDLKHGLESYPVYKGFQNEIFKIYMSDENSENMQKQSPIFRVSDNTNALLLVHGFNDPIVDYGESLRMLNDMKERNLNVLGILFKNEGHSIKKVKNKKILYSLLEGFLEQFLLKENKIRLSCNDDEDVLIYSNFQEI